MNAGPGGFGHAPVTKGVLLSSIGATLLSHVTRNSYRRMPLALAHSAHLLAFRSSGELLCGALLLYYFRVFERQSGSRRFGAYAVAVTGLTYALQALITRLLQLAHASGASSGASMLPMSLPLIFASFVPFLLDIPASNRFSLGAWKLSEKAFVYLLGVQLLLSSGRRSMLAGACGLVSGLLYRLDVMHIRTQFRLPSVVTRFASRVFAPLFADSRSSPPITLATDARVTGGAVGSGQGHAARRPQERQQQPMASAPPVPFVPSEDALKSLLAMGFDRGSALRALEQANNDVPTAISLLV